MIRKLIPAAFAAALLMSMQIANAGVLFFSANLTGAAEDPPVLSGGTGHVAVTFDDVTSMLTVDVSFSGLIGLTTFAHIHCCTAAPSAGNVGVATELPTLPGFPAGVMAGVYTETFDLSDAASFNPAFIAASPGSTVAAAQARLIGGLLAGTAYLNIHTTVFPRGEIRGFPVAEPQTLSLAALLLLALPALRRRRTVN